MYKALVVDDEKMIRMGIKRAVQWEELKIQEVYTASSARGALEIMEKENINLLITDIQMTEMTGLELIEKAKLLWPHIKVIVLTGYDSFEYARQSLRLQVQEFFLKPIDEDDLYGAIKKLINELEMEEDEKKSSKILKRTQSIAEQVLLESCMRDLVHRRKEQAELLQILGEKYNVDVRRKVQVVFIMPTLYMASYPIEQNFEALSVKNICMSMVDAQEEGITFLDDEGIIVIVYYEDDDRGSVLEKTETLFNILKDEFNTKPQMIIGSNVKGFENLYISYNDAMYLLNTEKKGIQDIIQTYGAKNKDDIFKDIYLELKGIICSNIGNTEYVLKVYNTFQRATESYNLSSQLVRRLCFELASAVYFTYIGNVGEVEEGKLDMLSKSLLSANREEACEVTKMFISQMIGKKDEKVHEIIEKAKLYIAEHLTEDITVSNIASSLYITPNYFSRLFKRITNEGCNEYIVRKRIEKAKSLLETTSLKVGKIALMVGYRDINYFSLAFKKHTGKSPTKYRDEL